jgi:UDP-glucose 6-dehydrogenase
MKIFVNSFYSVKIQFFTEMYLTCQKAGADFNTVRRMMLANEQIHSSFTNVPGHDGQISYGGLCFPKDTNALNQYMLRNNIPNGLLEACIKERNQMRNDHDNCHLY